MLMLWDSAICNCFSYDLTFAALSVVVPNTTLMVLSGSFSQTSEHNTGDYSPLYAWWLHGFYSLIWIINLMYLIWPTHYWNIYGLQDKLFSIHHTAGMQDISSIFFQDKMTYCTILYLSFNCKCNSSDNTNESNSILFDRMTS